MSAFKHEFTSAAGRFQILKIKTHNYFRLNPEDITINEILL
jgi:hypothetical protein